MWRDGLKPATARREIEDSLDCEQLNRPNSLILIAFNRRYTLGTRPVFTSHGKSSDGPCTSGLQFLTDGTGLAK
jgi:hypothetical protein